MGLHVRLPRKPILVSLALVVTVAAVAAVGPARAEPAPVVVQVHREYVPPDIASVNSRNQPVKLAGELRSDEPVVMNFVFTTCSTICSMQTAALVELQQHLLRAGTRARFFSVTIDPDNDTPSALERFGARLGAVKDWTFITGGFDQMLKIQQAFDVYRGSKASHPPVVLMKKNAKAPWVRIEGFASGTELRSIFSRLPSA